MSGVAARAPWLQLSVKMVPSMWLLLAYSPESHLQRQSPRRLRPQSFRSDQATDKLSIS